MEQKEFEKVVKDRTDACLSLLFSKNAAYNEEDDKLRNFKVAANLQNQSPAQALGGLWAKHITSIYDMINSDDYYPMAVWDEKLNDSINYALLLGAIIKDEHLKIVSQNDVVDRSRADFVDFA